MAIDDDIALFASVPTLALLGEESLRILAIGADRRQLRGGDILFREGTVSDSAFVVESGTFLLTREIRGAETEVGRVGAQTLLGELALVTETRRPATATALESADVVRISRVLFLRMCEGYPQAAARLYSALQARAEDNLALLRRIEARGPAPTTYRE